MKIKPIQGFAAEFVAPQDKMQTVNALIFSAFEKGAHFVDNGLIAEDTLALVSALEAFGASFDIKKEGIKVKGAEKLESGKSIFIKSGEYSIKLLIGALVGLKITAEICGGEDLTNIDFSSLISAMEKSGAKLTSSGGKLPIKILSFGNDKIAVRVTNSDIKSAVLMQGYYSGKGAEITEATPLNNHTENMLAVNGADVKIKDSIVYLGTKKAAFKDFFVTGDISSSAYYLALGIALGEVTVKNVGLNETRLGFLTALEKLGAKLKIEKKGEKNKEPFGDITAYKSNLKGATLKGSDYPSFYENMPIIALLAGICKGEATISWSSTYYKSNSQAIFDTAELIKLLGGNIKVEGSFLHIIGLSDYLGGVLIGETNAELIMTAAVGLMLSRYGGFLVGSDNVKKSFPDFFKKLNVNNFVVIGKAFSVLYYPILHKRIISKLFSEEFSYSAMLLKAEELEGFLMDNEYSGINLASPYKVTAWEFLKEQGFSLPRETTVDTIFKKSTYNAEKYGFMQTLKLNEIEKEAKTFLVIGDGGTARSVIGELLTARSRVYVYSLSKKVEELKNTFIRIRILPSLYGSYDYIINASDQNEVAFIESAMLKNKTIIDLSYNIKPTKFLTMAQKYGYKSINGLSTVFYKAFYSDLVFFGEKNNEEKYLKIAAQLYEEICLEAEAANEQK